MSKEERAERIKLIERLYTKEQLAMQVVDNEHLSNELLNLSEQLQTVKEEKEELSEVALLATNEVTEIRNALTENDNFGENLPTLEILIRVLEQDNYNIELLTQQNKQMREDILKMKDLQCLKLYQHKLKGGE